MLFAHRQPFWILSTTLQGMPAASKCAAVPLVARMPKPSSYMHRSQLSAAALEEVIINVVRTMLAFLEHHAAGNACCLQVCSCALA